jgi:hypothetical protein
MSRQAMDEPLTDDELEVLKQRELRLSRRPVPGEQDPPAALLPPPVDILPSPDPDASTSPSTSPPATRLERYLDEHL